MSYRLINANEIANKYPEVNDMKCIYADLPNGMDGKLYNFHGKEAVIDRVLEIIDEIEHDTGHVAIIGDDNKFAGVLCNSSEFRDRVLALKGGDQA